ncbi:4-(cytidine 5'-diphospho)-2-C-methyl-D-erythritol kinase [Tetragenococcus halophilus]|uniref:4-(cytidine 5'-diphospho)-2-C-methyl-D-erythritol kinase n=1 Tax=Tetragenococcus halophilus TaxID=51669 RepID=UPI000B92736C|nr:4-(cytidine 5'-diphospho)-2-C-methyl-D-erythritol kinase [Tetragenococcus halophilus]QXN86916.1 4-(cytidine 5'-diphospho)-2-C-methyl-D-erythritol kinase [Tetragenococcus halophilus]WJS82030.1 4-(cytidine 5'-diphospho)-2-C-methyl-D-erythritol kinase [Tetragenococcus halophilus]GBD70053.1 4-diphosphocytidyl-2-C-methyl-D-erythritol kinase [Tetragenococcus halophilus subsp. halophilus]GBD72062.1 4-diphosphocytidyl-2-C-methyl-D-erythritol kinase [Tetragenococcus halophilus subsp. halophilus]GBD7
MEIIEKAPAKINLGLDVLYKREDNYHELEMVMSSVDLADHLSFEPLREDQIVIESNKAFLPSDQRNNVYQAAAIIKKRYGIVEGIKITIKKNIPVAAGLGGGSTDCAATLRGLNRLWKLELSMEEMIDIGMHVGTDVPYCLYGTTSFIAGKGEIVNVLKPMSPCWVILVKPQLSVSTRKIFQQVDMTQITHPNMKELASAILRQDYSDMLYYMGNSLEDVTIPKHPIIQQIKSRMMKFGADIALMSGSGPTVFALCQKQSRAKRIVNGVKGFCDEVYMVRTLR